MRRLVYSWCALLLLFGQQTAFTHAIWHVGDGHAPQTEHAWPVAEHAAGHERGEGSVPELCAFHDVFAETLSGCASAALQITDVPAAQVRIERAAAARTKAEVIAAVSRGPPSLL